MTGSRRRVGVPVLALLGLLLVVGIGAGIVLRRADRRAAAEDREIAALERRLDTDGGDAQDHHRVGLSMLAKGDVEGLAHLELAAEKDPGNLEIGNDVRTWAVRHRQYDRSIRFFERLAERNGDLPEPRLNLALAYVDKMPDHMMGIVGQGRLSKQSIAELSGILERSGTRIRPLTLWAVYFALGKNHLYWPKMMRHAPSAEVAFRKCLDLGQDGAQGPGKARPVFYALAYEGLGDALVKQGRHTQARAIWREGQALFPDNVDLKTRLGFQDDAALTAYIDRTRGLGVVVDTDLSVFWRNTIRAAGGVEKSP